jgi:hypothetical protein
MSHRSYFLVCATVVLVVALAHLTRLLAGWDIGIAGWAVPRWISVPGLIVPGFLSAWGFVLAARARPTT